jgi:zinc/manganese transport system substrate-binding protein
MRSDALAPRSRALPRPGARHLAAVCALALAAGGAQAQTVFACGPEWAALVRTLLPQARVHVATHAGQDPHHIDARPGLIAQVRSADLAVCTGAELEIGWLPVLLQRAANPRVREVFYGAEHVDLLDERPGVVATPWSGDVHAHGNPHLHTDPRRLLQAADALAQWMAPVFPAQAAQIAARQAAFARAWQADIARWQQRAAPLRGQRVAVQHGTFAYLLDWLGLEVVADLEPRPGMPPTPGHLNRVRDSLRAAPPMAVVLASYQDLRPARWLHSQVPEVALVVLPATADQRADAEGLRRWMDGLLDSLLTAHRARGETAQGPAQGSAQGWGQQEASAGSPPPAAATAGTAAAR